MAPNAPRGRGESGFTLIEVLIALTILAVGLLAIEALSIGAARAVTRANAQRTYLARATTEMEALTAMLQNDVQNTSVSQSQNLDGRATLYLRAAPTGTRWDVRVTIVPTSHPVLAARDSVSLTATVFDP